ncbi:protein of unknown function [Methanocaldococcus lauensis]|uniref:Uncharacterized protein n=1 Tax=Methanocaldococcus lauensis TaxID=2546128 RepID=A0A8D6SXM6_9EURY|nr:protein of unknown function [Methanocaldococcus lauensis]
MIRKVIANRLDKYKYIPFFIDFRGKNVVSIDNFAVHS